MNITFEMTLINFLKNLMIKGKLIAINGILFLNIRLQEFSSDINLKLESFYSTLHGLQLLPRWCNLSEEFDTDFLIKLYKVLIVM